MNLADLVRRMAAAGAPPEAIAIAIEAIEQSEEARKRPARERKQRQRDNARVERDEDVTVVGHSRDDSVTVTGQGRDTLSPSLSSPQTPQQTHPHTRVINNSRARGTRLATDFALPPDWRDWAVSEKGWSREDVEEEGEAFADFWRAKPGKDGTKLDWPATWRNWVRNSRKQAERSRGGRRQFADGPLC